MTEAGAAAAAVLEGLNEQQRTAVSAPAGPTLVFAGAGSGKTRVLTRRIAWRVLADGAAPEGTLAVTFTNKAAREMSGRIEQFGSGEWDRVWSSTFHALGLRLLRMFGEEVGLEKGFAIFGADEAKTLAGAIARALQFDEDLKPAVVARLVSRVRTAEALGAPLSSGGDTRRYRQRLDSFREVAARYEEELRRQNAVDFDDLILLADRLLEADGPAREFVGRRARHLLVDEYQDTSALQHRLIRRLAPHGDVFVVGDDDQAIYSFRGADHRNIHAFRGDFPGARVFRLEDNYRSTGSILDAANALIRRNRSREGKTLRPVGEAGAPVSLLVEPGEAREAGAVAAAIRDRGDARGSCAVLYRTRAQSRAFEEAFTARRIPHVVVGGLRFFERREVLDALAGVRLAVRRDDDAAFRRALGAIPRGVGKATLRQIEAAAAERESSLREAAAALLEEEVFGGRIAEGLSEFLSGMEAVERAAGDGAAAVVEAALEETGLADHYRGDGDREEHLESLRESAREFERRNPDTGVAEFLDQVSLLSAEDFVPDEAAGGPGPVMLMTVHAAKGLEFDTVFLCGLWEGLLPHQFSLQRRDSLEEERRLFYVGMTRARKSLTLTAAPSGFHASKGISRFVAEIPKEMLSGAAREKVRAAATRTADNRRFRPGDAVRHPRFGRGRVESADSDGTRVTVLFRTAGRKRLVLEYAGLHPA